MLKEEKQNIYLGERRDHALTHCPCCSSENVWRILRTEPEKLVCYLSNKKFEIKKYLCQDCEFTILLHDNGQHIEKLEEAQSKTYLPYVNCANCGAHKLKTVEVSGLDAALYNKNTGKKAFKKVICAACKTEQIINREDYDACNENIT